MSINVGKRSRVTLGPLRVGSGAGVALAGGGEPVYAIPDLRDLFDVDEAAPMASPHTADIGSATLTDTTSKMSASGGYLVTTGGNALNDPQYYGAQRANAAGQYVYVKQETRDTFTSNGQFGFSTSVGLASSVGFLDAYNQVKPYLASGSGVDHGLTNGVNTNGTYDDVPLYIESLIVMTKPGALWFQRHKQGQWMLVHVDPGVYDVANLYPRLNNLAKKFYVDTFESGSMADDARFASFGANATAYAATSSNGETFTATANAVIHHTITAATGVTQELMIRRTDDNNCWIARMDQAASKIYLYEKVAGVETERGATGGVAQTWTNGTAYKIVVTADYRNIRVSVAGTHKVAYAKATFNQTETGVKVSHAGTAFAAYPRRWSINGFTAKKQRLIWAVGDSKLAQGDDSGGWSTRLVSVLPAIWGQSLRDGRSSYGVNYGTTGSLKFIDVIDGDLALRYDAPDYIPISLGVNDVNLSGNEAQWVTDYQYVIDAIHDRFPNARVWVALPWKQGWDTIADSLADTYIPQVIAGRSWASIGVDERIVLKGDDDGATNTTDGIHPSPAGHAALAAAWQTVMGL